MLILLLMDHLHDCSQSLQFVSKAKINGGRGVTFTKIVHGCACRSSKIWHSLYQFFAQFPTHQYTIFDRKHLILPKLGAFYNNFAQNTPYFCIMGSFVSDENRLIGIPDFKRQPHVYHVNVRTLLGVVLYEAFKSKI